MVHCAKTADWYQYCFGLLQYLKTYTYDAIDVQKKPQRAACLLFKSICFLNRRVCCFHIYSICSSLSNAPLGCYFDSVILISSLATSCNVSMWAKPFALLKFSDPLEACYLLGNPLVENLVYIFCSVQLSIFRSTWWQAASDRLELVIWDLMHQNGWWFRIQLIDWLFLWFSM